jgi:N-acyl homoserine lactone hydrolase
MKWTRRNLMGCLLVPVLPGAAGTAPAVSVKVYALRAGSLKTQTQYLVKDTRVGTPMEIPMVFLVIQHGREWVAFDTGCNAAVPKDPAGYWGEATVKAYVPVIKPEEEFREAIKVLGLAPRDFKAVVLSHGHLDHAGAIDNFAGTGVPVYFQKAEMREIRKAVDAAQPGAAYCLGDFKCLKELNIREVDGIFDVFGDQTVMAFPTPGHTVGHQSLYVKLAPGEEMIYCADALYTMEIMERFVPPGLATDMAQAMEEVRWFQLEQRRGVKIVPSHDPGYWAKRAWAPKELVP